MPIAATTVADSDLLPVSPAAARELKLTSERRQEFEDILPQVLPRFRRIATRWLDNRDDAEDAIQDAMLSAFTHITQFDGRAKMSTWLTAIVINAVRMQMRRRRRVPMLPLDHSPREGQPAISEHLMDPRPTPEKALERFELYGLTVKLTRSLAPSQRAALHLRHQNDFSIRQTAEKLGIPENTVKAQLARGRARLRERLRKVVAEPVFATTE